MRHKCNLSFSCSSSCWHTSSCWLGSELLLSPPSRSLFTLTSGTFARMLLCWREPRSAWTHASTVRLSFSNWSLDTSWWSCSLINDITYGIRDIYCIHIYIYIWWLKTQHLPIALVFWILKGSFLNLYRWSLKDILLYKSLTRSVDHREFAIFFGFNDPKGCNIQLDIDQTHIHKNLANDFQLSVDSPLVSSHSRRLWVNNHLYRSLCNSEALFVHYTRYVITTVIISDILVAGSVIISVILLLYVFQVLSHSLKEKQYVLEQRSSTRCANPMRWRQYDV